jgi:integrase
MYPQEPNSTVKTVLSKTTVDEYLRVIILISKFGGDPFQAIVTKSRARVIKAAVRWAIEQTKRGDIASNPLLPDISLALERLGGIDHANELINAINIDSLKRRVGRVKKLNGLEPEWALRLVTATEMETPVEHAAVVALFLTGCRISELADFQICSLPRALGVVIRGKKLKENAGQKVRKIAFPIEGLVTKLTALCPSDRSFVRPFESLKIRRVERILEKASQHTQGSPRRVNSSCLRNHVASMAKAANWEPAKIAELLGHQTEDTQKYYGRAVKGLGSQRTGWVEPIKVAASTGIRPAAPKPFGENLSVQEREDPSEGQ